MFSSDHFAATDEKYYNAVMGIRLRDALSQNEIAGSAIEEILKYYHCKPKDEELPSSVKTVEEQCEDVPRDMTPYTDADSHKYDFAFGMNWKGVINDKRVKRYR